jgi:DNA-binding NtrC family response regulator
LRERVKDVPLLVNYFLHSYREMHQSTASELSAEAMDALLAHRWPGNVRELKNVVERIVLKATGPVVGLADLPADLRRSLSARASSHAPAGVEAAPQSTRAQELASLMLDHGESFWAVVYPQFVARDLTRADLRKVIQTGLERTNGNYRMLVELFNMPTGDYKRFLSFLRKHDCHLPFQRFRAVPAKLQPPQSPPASKAQA